MPAKSAAARAEADDDARPAEPAAGQKAAPGRPHRVPAGDAPKRGAKAGGEADTNNAGETRVGRFDKIPIGRVLRAFAVVHLVIAAMFAAAALLLLVVAVHSTWVGFKDGFGAEAAMGLIKAIGLIAIAVVSLQIAQTIAEEEVVRHAHISAPTRVRRFLSRFLVVVVVALAIEGLVATFKALHENPSDLWYAAAVLVGVAALLAGWGVFIRFNMAAEKLEPEAMEEAKSEDAKLDQA